MDSLTLPYKRTHTHTAAVVRLSCILDSIHGRLSEQGLCFFQVEFSNFVLKYLLTGPMCLPHRFLQHRWILRGSVEMRRSWLLLFVNILAGNFSPRWNFELWAASDNQKTSFSLMCTGGWCSGGCAHKGGVDRTELDEEVSSLAPLANLMRGHVQINRSRPFQVLHGGGFAIPTLGKVFLPRPAYSLSGEAGAAVHQQMRTLREAIGGCSPPPGWPGERLCHCLPAPVVPTCIGAGHGRTRNRPRLG